MSRERSATQEQPLVRFGWDCQLERALVSGSVDFCADRNRGSFYCRAAASSKPRETRDSGGKNFWTLVPFTMQMVMIIVGGYVVASTPIVYRAIRALAGFRRRRVERLPWWLCSPCSRR